jgi:hypothetical protein
MTNLNCLRRAIGSSGGIGIGNRQERRKALSPAMEIEFCSGMEKAMHAMQYSNPEMYNAV